MSVLQCRDLCISRGGNQILGPLNLDIPKGCRLAIIGPNGAGKSTLIKCLTHIYRDYQGSIELHQKDLKTYKQQAIAQRIAYVPQSLEKMPSYPVEEFVLLGRYPHLGPFSPIRAGDRQLIKNILEELELSHLAKRSMDTLSGGERQRVLIAAALAQEPEILLLDEPFTFLDPPHQVAGAQLLLDLHQQSDKTIVIVTHELTPAILHHYQILAMDQGKCFFFGTSQELIDQRILDQLFGIPFQHIAYPNSNQTIALPWKPL